MEPDSQPPPPPTRTRSSPGQVAKAVAQSGSALFIRYVLPAAIAATGAVYIARINNQGEFAKAKLGVERLAEAVNAGIERDQKRDTEAAQMKGHIESLEALLAASVAGRMLEPPAAGGRTRTTTETSHVAEAGAGPPPAPPIGRIGSGGHFGAPGYGADGAPARPAVRPMLRPLAPAQPHPVVLGSGAPTAPVRDTLAEKLKILAADPTLKRAPMQAQQAVPVDFDSLIKSR